MPDTEDEDLFVAPDAEQEAPEPDADGEDETPEISFGDEPAPEQTEPQGRDLVRQLRAELADRNRQLAALRPVEKPIEVGDKPKLDDFYVSHPDNPEAGYDEALLAWNGRKAQAEDEAKARKKAAEDTNAKWQSELETFQQQKAALRATDFDTAEQTVIDNLPPGYPQAIVKASKDAAKVMYALAKHPDKLAALAKLDMVQFIAEVARMEGQITVNSNRRPPPPEGNVRGSAPLSRSSDKVLEKMEADAAKDPSYDRGRIVRYRAQKAADRAPAGRR